MTRKRIFSWFFVSLLVLWEAAVFTLPVQPVSADETLFNSQTGMAELGTVYGHTKTDIRVIIGNIITIALGFLALLFLVLTLIAGFQYMTSGGNEENPDGQETFDQCPYRPGHRLNGLGDHPLHFAPPGRGYQ